MKRLFIAAAVALSVSFAGLAVAAHGQDAAGQAVTATKLTICHKTGSDTWRRITVSSRALTNTKSASGKTLRAHMRHTGDAVVVGTAACPSASLTPAPSSTPPTKITICHKTGSTSNPYRRITISSQAMTKPSSPAGKTLRGHAQHSGDILMPGAIPCPSGPTPVQAKLTANLQPVQGAMGSGSFTAMIRVSRGELCYTLTVSGLTDVTAAHIHRGSTGAIVIPLTAPTTGSSAGCTDAAKTLLQEIVRDPQAFYVNVHTQSHPSGEIQGKLSR